MKKIAEFLLVFFLFASFQYAQFLPRKWVKVYEDSTAKVYVDTTSIRERSSQIILWTLEDYTQGKSVRGIPQTVFRAKNQYVINDLTKRFSTLGSLYYDKLGKLIGDNYNRNITGAGEIFSKPVNLNLKIKSIYDFTKKYLNSSLRSREKIAKSDSSEIESPKRAEKTVSETPKDTVRETAKKKTDIPAFSLSKSATQKPIPKKKNTKPKKSVARELSREKIVATPQTVFQLKNEKPLASTELPKPKVPVIPKEDITKKSPTTSTKAPGEVSKAGKYNSKKERFVTSTILTDGNLYVIQVSSWKNSRIAQKQLEKLKKLGYNAFIVRVYIKRKHGTWNRVRVGYFKTLREAKKIEKKIRKQIS